MANNIFQKLYFARYCLPTFEATVRFLAKQVHESPQENFDYILKRGYLMKDFAQLKVMQELQRVFDEISVYECPSELIVDDFYAAKRPPPKGLYYYGVKGSGKTMLLDIFYTNCGIERKRKITFRKFMNEVHWNIEEFIKRNSNFSENNQEPYDPIPIIARHITEQSWLICFDDFYVTELKDVLIMETLFTKLFRNGVVVVAASNKPLEDLYKVGEKAKVFLSFIPFLKAHCAVRELHSNIDYRVSEVCDVHYFVKERGRRESNVEDVYHRLCYRQNAVVCPRTFLCNGVEFTFENTCGEALNATYHDLCEHQWRSHEYKNLIQSFRTIIIRNVPQMSLEITDTIKRFIMLIDFLHAAKTRVIISADVPLSELVPIKKYPLPLTEQCIRLEKNIETGGDSVCEFTSCPGKELNSMLEKLVEMQTKKYWHSGNILSNIK